MNCAVRSALSLLVATFLVALALPACKKDTGQGPAHPKLGATGNRFIPNSWQTPAWYIDPANSTGNASDSNSGTSPTSALLTWHHLNDELWGCESAAGGGCPRLQQTTTINFLSSHGNGADPVYFWPTLEGGSQVILQGPLGSAQQICSGTLSGVVSKVRATPQLLNASLCASAAVGQLLVNTTHPAKSWVYKLVSGTTFALSQPLTSVNPTALAGPAEVDTFANGDAYALYSPVAVNFVSIRPITADLSATLNNSAVVYNLGVFEPNVAYNLDEFQVGSQAMLVETSSLKAIRWMGQSDPTQVDSKSYNSFLGIGMRGSGMSVPGAIIGLWVHGGVLGASSAPLFAPVRMASANITDDAIVGTQAGVANILSGQIGAIYLDSGVTLQGINLRFAPLSGAGVAVWGLGAINVIGSGRFSYNAPATGVFLTTGAMKLNSSTTGCSADLTAAPSTLNCGITINPANLAAAVGAAGFGGTAFSPGGASYSSGLQ